MRLYRGGRAAGRRHALDHVGIKRALGEEIDLAELLGLRIEHVDEQLADHLALHLGVGDAGERDEDAGELVADRLMDEERGNGRIDPAGEPANHLPVAYLRTDARHRLLAEM